MKVLLVLALVCGCRNSEPARGEQAVAPALCAEALDRHLREVAEDITAALRRGISPNALGLMRARIDIRNFASPACRFPNRVIGQGEYLLLLVETGQLMRAAVQLDELRKAVPERWPAPPVEVRPEDAAAFVRDHHPRPFRLTAWERVAVGSLSGPQSEALILLEGAARAWQYAVVRRRDLFEVTPPPDDIVASVRMSLEQLGLPAPEYVVGTPFADWAWTAPATALNELARRFEGDVPDTDPMLNELREGKYSVEVFQHALAAIRKS